MPRPNLLQKLDLGDEVVAEIVVNHDMDDGTHRGYIHFSTYTPIDERHAIKAQQMLGWHPCGYMHYGYKQWPSGKTEWKCSANCD